jgi:hypothetical protein
MRYGLLSFAFALLMSLPSLAHAQGLNYVDEAGNIYFVDNIDQVPMQYRNQFIEAKPTLSPDSRAGKEYERNLKRRQIEIERAKKKKEKEEAKKKKLAEKEKKKKEKETEKDKKKKKKKKES